MKNILIRVLIGPIVAALVIVSQFETKVRSVVDGIHVNNGVDDVLE